MVKDGSAPIGAAQAALEYVEPGMTLGLGTGRAATAFVEALGARVAEGLDIVGVPTSDATEQLARELDIPLTTLSEAGRLDITFDGADEVDPALDLIKGYGAAMVREKIVAASSERFIILVGPEKLVDAIGARGRLPIEVLPFGADLVTHELSRLGLDTELRPGQDDETLVTDNGNWVLDAKLDGSIDAAQLEAQIVALPGVLGTGFFLDMADVVLIGSGQEVEVRRRTDA